MSKQASPLTKFLPFLLPDQPIAGRGAVNGRTGSYAGERPRASKPSIVRWHVLLMPLCFIPMVTYWILGPSYVAHLQTFILATLLNFTLVGCCVLTLNTLNKRVIRRYPTLGQTVPRVWRVSLVFLLVTPLFLTGGVYLYSYFQFFGYKYTPGLLSRILLYNVVANVLSVGIEEMVYSLTKWREMTIEREELRKVNLQSQYESLKSQVNPHFLFNTLNTLSSLIGDEPQRAEKFVDEMAKVYRYLLQTNNGQTNDPASLGYAAVGREDRELTTLATELQFIRSYFHLLKTRYHAGIELKINVPDHYMLQRLPPLTLQMLVENAVKHNVISISKPLLLELLIHPTPSDRKHSGPEAVHLQVRNNLQRKSTRLSEQRVLSNQIGLANIVAKYRLLGQTIPIIQEEDGFFSVYLVLFPAL